MSLANLILDLVAEKPSNGFEIARALEERHKVGLKGREGALYAALVQLERGGFVTAVAEGAPGGARRWRYHLPVLTDLAPEDSELAEIPEAAEEAEPEAVEPEAVDSEKEAADASDETEITTDETEITTDETEITTDETEITTDETEVTADAEAPEAVEKVERPGEVPE